MPCIHVVGTSGSGKTTLAQQIAKRLAIPHVELDALQWQPDWTPTESSLLLAQVADALSGDAWVVDGNYSMLRDITWARADTLIWLDYSLPLVFSRITRRTVNRLIKRTELWNGNRERLRDVFSRESIILWALTTWGRNRRHYGDLLAHPELHPESAHLHIIRLRSPRETRRWLQQLAAPQPIPVH